jgi:hypothetical protein
VLLGLADGERRGDGAGGLQESGKVMLDRRRAKEGKRVQLGKSQWRVAEEHGVNRTVWKLARGEGCNDERGGIGEGLLVKARLETMNFESRRAKN